MITLRPFFKKIVLLSVLLKTDGKGVVNIQREELKFVIKLAKLIKKKGDTIGNNLYK